MSEIRSNRRLHFYVFMYLCVSAIYEKRDANGVSAIVIYLDSGFSRHRRGPSSTGRVLIITGSNLARLALEKACDRGRSRTFRASWLARLMEKSIFPALDALAGSNTACARARYGLQ